MNVRLQPGLRLSIGRDAVSLAPSEGLRLAEMLIRASTRRMVEEEAATPRKLRSIVRKAITE